MKVFFIFLFFNCCNLFSAELICKYRVKDSSSDFNYKSVVVDSKKKSVLLTLESSKNQSAILIMPILSAKLFSNESVVDYLKIESLNKNIVDQLSNNSILHISGKCCYFSADSKILHVYNIDLQYEILKSKDNVKIMEAVENISKESLLLKSRTIKENVIQLE